jgi:hypothetical protein
MSPMGAKGQQCASAHAQKALTFIHWRTRRTGPCSHVRDACQRQHALMRPVGWSLAPTTTAAPTREDDPPTFSLVPGVTPDVVSPGANVPVRISVQDETAVASVEFTFYHPSQPWLPQGYARLISGTLQDGISEVVGSIPADVLIEYPEADEFKIVVLVHDTWWNTLNQTTIGYFSVV